MEIVLQCRVLGFVLNADESQKLFKVLCGDSMKNVERALFRGRVSS